MLQRGCHLQLESENIQKKSRQVPLRIHRQGLSWILLLQLPNQVARATDTQTMIPPKSNFYRLKSHVNLRKPRRVNYLATRSFQRYPVVVVESSISKCLFPRGIVCVVLSGFFPFM